MEKSDRDELQPSPFLLSPICLVKATFLEIVKVVVGVSDQIYA